MAHATLEGKWAEKIKDMRKGEVGYTVPWAYQVETEELDESFSVQEKGGSASMRVRCIIPGVYYTAKLERPS